MKAMIIRGIVGIFVVFSFARGDSVWFNDTCGVPGSNVTLTVMAEIDSPGILAVELTLNFPPDSLEFIDLNTEGTFLEGWMVASNDSPPGFLKIASAGTQRVYGYGPLIYLTFLVSPEFQDSFLITLTGVLDNTPFRDTFMNFKRCPFNVEEGVLPGGKGSLKLFPNPFSHNLTIELSGVAPGSRGVRIFDSSGKEVFFVPFERKGKGFRATWSGESFKGYRVPAGVYFISLDRGRQKLKPVLFIP